MARYLDIDVQQDPFDSGPDASKRQTYSFNVLCTKEAGSTTFEEEIIAILVAASVAASSSIFPSTGAVIPTTGGPYLSVIKTQGLRGLRIHNSAAPAYERPGARIVVRAVTAQAARTMAWAAYNALAPVRNATVTP